MICTDNFYYHPFVSIVVFHTHFIHSTVHSNITCVLIVQVAEGNVGDGGNDVAQ